MGLSRTHGYFLLWALNLWSEYLPQLWAFKLQGEPKLRSTVSQLRKDFYHTCATISFAEGCLGITPFSL